MIVKDAEYTLNIIINKSVYIIEHLVVIHTSDDEIVYYNKNHNKIYIKSRKWFENNTKEYIE